MKNKKLIAIMTLVCFMLTLMPVAAFAADEEYTIVIDEQRSYVYLNDTKADTDEDVEVEFSLDYLTNANSTSAQTLYVWFEDESRANVPVNAFYKAVAGDDAEILTDVSADGIVEVEVADNATIDVYFDRAGDYVVHAATVNPATYSGEKTWAGKIADVADYELNTTSDDTVTIEEDSDSADYVLRVDGMGTPEKGDGVEYAGKTYLTDDDTLVVPAAEADGAYTYEMAFKLFEGFVYEKDKNGKDQIAGVGDEVYEEVDIDTTSGVTVTDLEVKRSGVITFDFTANKTGTHKIYIDIDGFEVTIEVDANEGEADEIEIAYVSKNAINIDNANPRGGLLDYIEFDIYDEKGDDVEACDKTDEDSGVFGAMNSDDEEYKNYVMLTDKPADSDLESEDFYLKWYEIDERTAGAVGDKAAKNFSSGWTIAGPSSIDEEGTYSFKVVLDNGDSVSFSLTFQEFDDAVALRAVYHTNNVVVGGTIEPRSIVRVDANGVTETVWSEKRSDAMNSVLIGNSNDYEVRFAASGAAIEEVKGVAITVKDDEDYVGSTIKVSVVDTENDLVASTILTVVDEDAELAFSVDSIPVDTTKTVTVTLVDENGKAVALNADATEAYVVVLDKPAGADVDVEVGTTKDIAKKGKFDFTINSDTAGVVTVQAMMEMNDKGTVRYYSGIGEIQVGASADTFENTVVVSIGANKMVVNNELVALDVAPYIENSRTMLQYNVLYVFGVDVQWVAETSSVVAEGNGIKVVMTIGEKTAVVNGEEVALDVAPQIVNGRTIVPVGFITGTFGISPTFTYNADGTIADILFAM